VFSALLIKIIIFATSDEKYDIRERVINRSSPSIDLAVFLTCAMLDPERNKVDVGKHLERKKSTSSTTL
jgi:hypothetical protein